MSLHTDNLEAAIRVKLSDVSGAEPTLAVRIHKEVLSVLLLVFIVTHCDVGTANHNLSSWVWFIGAEITTYGQKEKDIKMGNI